MVKKVLILSSFLILFSSCMMTADHHRQEIVYENGKLQKYSYLGDTYGDKDKSQQDSSVFLDAIDIIKQCDQEALPEIKDLPQPRKRKISKVRKYVGLICNYSRDDISIPSDNSSATLIIPAHGSREYIVWRRTVDLNGYVQGRKIYHQKIIIGAKKFRYMGKNYDFRAEIIPPPTVQEYKPIQKKRPLRNKPKCGRGVEALG